MIDGLARRWGCPPSAVLAEPAPLLMAILASMGDPPTPEVPEAVERFTALKGLIVG